MKHTKEKLSFYPHKVEKVIAAFLKVNPDKVNKAMKKLKSKSK